MLKKEGKVVLDSEKNLENLKFEIDKNLRLDEIAESIGKQLDDFAQDDNKKWAEASEQAIEQLEEQFGVEATAIITLHLLILYMS